MSEVGANALLPTGGAGGLALGAWALKRGGMPAHEIARRTVAFFLLTSIANVLGVIVLGIGLAVGVLPGEGNLLRPCCRPPSPHWQSSDRCSPDAPRQLCMRACCKARSEAPRHAPSSPSSHSWRSQTG